MTKRKQGEELARRARDEKKPVRSTKAEQTPSSKTTSSKQFNNLRLILAVPYNQGEDSVVVPLALRLREAGVPVQCVELSLGCSEESAGNDAQWVEQLRNALQVEEHVEKGSVVVVGGFSLGARIAVTLAASTDSKMPQRLVEGVLALGFPAHQRGKPTLQHGLEALRGLELPALVIQGSRDSHGSESEFRGYKSIPTSVQFHWLADANHRWHPRLNSEYKREDHLDSAVQATLRFLATLLSDRGNKT